MTQMKEVPVDQNLLKLATELGFTDLHKLQRHFGLSPLFYARWKGSPVWISHQIGIDGPMGVVFNNGIAIPTQVGLLSKLPVSAEQEG
jgi:hypothetical protein